MSNHTQTYTHALRRIADPTTNRITNTRTDLTIKDLFSRIVLMTEVGSTVHGINLPGNDDLDFLAVAIPPLTHTLGLKNFEHFVYRTKAEGERSTHEDIDLTVYSLQKATRLLLAANPTVLLLLFTPNDRCPLLCQEGQALRRLSRAIASKKAATSFLGYIETQQERLEGRKGQMRVNRPELVEQHGFDTKYASHIVRLAYQGIEYLQHGRFTVPMHPAHQAAIRSLRSGEISFQDAQAWINELIQQLRDAERFSSLPDEPDYADVNRFLIEAHISFWRRTGELPPERE